MNSLQRMGAKAPSLAATALLGSDGEIEAMDAPSSMEGVLAPVCTALLGVAERACAELGRGGLQRVVLEGPRGVVVGKALTGGRTLVALADAGAPLGLVLDDVASMAAGLMVDGEVQDA